MTQFSQQIFGELNDALLQANASDDPITVTFRGRPQVRILSLDPLSYNEFGRWRGRGPRLAGRYLLASLIDLSDADSVMPYGVMRVEQTLYAAPIGLTVINALTDQLGIDDINWVLQGEHDPDQEFDPPPDFTPKRNVISMQDFQSRQSPQP